MPKTKKSAHLKDQRHEELENQLRRALADYQNLERRVGEERRLFSTLSSALLIEKFLPVLDNLESAQKHLNDQGLEIVIRQFKDILASESVEEIEAVGSQFDPNLHEAAEVQAGQNDNTVASVLAKGYKIGDKVLRPARVVVEKNSTGANQQDSSDQSENQEENVEEGGQYSSSE